MRFIEAFSHFYGSNSAPSTLLSQLGYHASDAAFVTAKGSAAVGGDMYINSTDGFIHYYTTSWQIDQDTTPKNNSIINGAMDIWTRGTSFASPATETFQADRWMYLKSGAMVHNITQSTDVPTFAQAGFKANYSLKAAVTTADGSIGASEYSMWAYFVEGYDLVPLSGKQLTLSFWAKKTKTGIHSVALRNEAHNRSYVAEYTINASNTWEFKTITFTHDPSGTWNYTNGAGLRIFFPNACGTTYQAPSNNAWLLGEYNASANQVNGEDTIGNINHIALVKLEIGSIATPFTRAEPTMADEERACDRYCSIFSQSSGIIPLKMDDAGGTQLSGIYNFRNFMRTAPSCTIANGTTGFIVADNNAHALTSFVCPLTTQKNAELRVTIAVGIGANTCILAQSGAGSILFNAEIPL